jgi:hypothetical protein
MSGMLVILAFLQASADGVDYAKNAADFISSEVPSTFKFP